MMFHSNFHGCRNYRLIAIITGMILLSSCIKKEVYPDIPQIEFQSFITQFDSGLYAKRGFLTISFKDGNGDIGLWPTQKDPPYETGSIYYYNYIIDYYEKQNGSFVKEHSR